MDAATPAQLSFKGRIWRAPDNLGEYSETNGIPPVLQRLLVQRSISSESFEDFLESKLSQIPDPALLKNCHFAAQKIIKAVKANLRIIVYGDFDVDGTSSTTILLHFLEFLKKSNLGSPSLGYYIPDRFAEGYGLNKKAIDIFAKDEVGLIITVDCGVSNLAEIDYADSKGIDVIVLDHHKVSNPIDSKYTIINPQQPGCEYPFKEICAAGVTFLVLLELRRVLRSESFFSPGSEPDLRIYLDFVGLATVADVMPLKDINRIFVKNGLKRIRRSSNTGLSALIQTADLSPEKISSSDFGFALGPRINACGRIEHAKLAVELFRESDFREALKKADYLSELNRERQDYQRKIEKEIKSLVDGLSKMPSAIVLSNPEWHQGILGIVAGKIREYSNRPVILLTEQEGEKLKGSGRSVPGFDLFQSLSKVKEFFNSFGGHSMACGMSLDKSNLSLLREHLEKDFQSQFLDKGWFPEFRVDCLADSSFYSAEFHNLISKLEPFGNANPRPVLLSTDMKLMDLRFIGKDNKHLKTKFLFSDENSKIPANAVAFGFGDFVKDLKIGDFYDVLWKIEINSFRGSDYLQMNIVDLRDASGEKSEN